MISSKEIRQMWLDFFAKKNHLVIESKSLIPQNDPSLLWINSGVATLKDYFSGKKIPPAKRLTNSQRSIRTNDIENVGVTSRHHTFFEMLGNFSIGDYFKNEAITYAYEFIFDILKLEKQRIYITYYEEDLDTYNKWIELGISKDHLIKGKKAQNFWDVGQGPCGPDTEIFYDRGSKFDSRGIELLIDDIENDRYIEIWNIVFSQFNNDGENNYTELATKNIDTGAGLERIVSIMQDAPTNFDTDLFLPIIREIEAMSIYTYDTNNYFVKEKKQTKINTLFKIIADHIRASVNAIADGVKPSNVGRGYIIRRLIRRSYRCGIELGIVYKSFLYKLVEAVNNSLVYPFDVNEVKKVIKDEEELFAKTIKDGEKLLENELAKNGYIDAKIAFKMFDTYGFPIELTTEILKEKNIEINLDQFNAYLKEHQDKSRSNIGPGMQKVINSLSLIPNLVSEFIGYDFLESKSKILYLLDEEKEISYTNSDDDISYLVLDKTPFYATSGGQNHDFGYILQGSNKIEIIDVFKDKFWNHIHVIKGKINKDLEVNCYVDAYRRINYARNHSSTHIMFHALRKTYVNDVIEQLGSNIHYDHFTFDFGLDHRPTKEEIRKIEKIMNEYISMHSKRNYIITSVKKAQELGAYMTIEESEYHDANKVRVVEFEGITKDLCGGTHVENSSVIENFKIVGIDSKGSGIYRLRVITSNKLVNEYLYNEIKEKQALLLSLIKNNKELKFDYDFIFDKEIPEDVFKKEELLDKYSLIENNIREDYKKILKDKNNEVLDLSKYQPIKIKKHNVFFVIEEDINYLRKLTIQLRESNPDAIIFGIIKTKEDSYFLIITSKEIDSSLIFKALGSKLSTKGGGNKLVSQGSITTTLEAKELINIFKDILNA